MVSKDTLDEITKIIVENYQPDKVILFGSYATGKATENSDLDLLIISDREKELPQRKRGVQLLYLLRKHHISKDILIYTQAEVDKWKNVKNAFVAEALSTGLVIHGG